MGQPVWNICDSNMSGLLLMQSLFISGSLCAGLAPGYGAPQHEYPKDNCTLETVTETIETCVPAFRNVCEQETAIVKKIIDVEQCFPVTKTVCTEGLEVVDNQICVYKYGPRSEETETKSVNVDYTTPCVTQIVTVCDPGYGYGDVQCKDVDQETCYQKNTVLRLSMDMLLGMTKNYELGTGN